MNAIWTLARKDLRLLLRDARAAIILLLMPVVFILVLGLSLGEGFGQKTDERVRVTVVNLDQGYKPMLARAAACQAVLPITGAMSGGITPMALVRANQPPPFPVNQTWAERVLEDLAKSADIRVEMVDTVEQAKQMVQGSKRPAVLIFGPHFSEKVARCSFLAGGVNPFYRSGVDLKAIDARVEKDFSQQVSASIIEQVAQGTMLRVVLPWMIGQAFEKIGEPEFIHRLSEDEKVRIEVAISKFLPTVDLAKVLGALNHDQKKQLAAGLQTALQNLFPKYDLTAKDWTKLTRSTPHGGEFEGPTQYQDPGGTGILNWGALRYQLLVPSYTVMFAFFLVLTVGWLFVAERRQGTMKRLSAAPLTRTQILLGKLIPCFLLSLFQGFFLLGAGRLIFGMSWGPQPWWLVAVVFSTSLAAMGLALLVAAMARTETQVAIYGTLLVLVMAGLSGSLMGDRSMMPPQMQTISRVTPHAWALDAYRQLLANPGEKDYEQVAWACLVLSGFGVGFLVLAWMALRLE
jgi:ABC-2 type transport system permease protein